MRSATIAGLSAELEEKKKAQADLISLQKELGPKDEEIRLLRTRMQDFYAQLTDAADFIGSGKDGRCE